MHIVHLQIAYLYDQKSLVDQLDVTTDFGGTLNYNHGYWVYNRLVGQYSSHTCICTHMYEHSVCNGWNVRTLQIVKCTYYFFQGDTIAKIFQGGGNTSLPPC